MTWVRLADDFSDHPKVVRAGPLAAWLFVCGLAYANRYLTDGYVPAGAVRRLADVDDPAALAARLVDVRLWEPADGGYRIHDYSTYQPSAEQVKAERAANARRQDLYRNQDLTRAVRERDGDLCRYCGRDVVWRDRRGPGGGTYDHIDPTGSNTLENLAVCCRACNASKGSRTPTAAGMVLRAAPGRNGAETMQVRASPGRNGSSDYVPPGPGPGPVNPVPADTSSPLPPPPQAEEGEQGAITAEDCQLWKRALEHLPTLKPGNREQVTQLEPVGRAPDGGLRLRAPPGHRLARFRPQIARALADAGDAHGTQVQIVER